MKDAYWDILLCGGKSRSHVCETFCNMLIIYFAAKNGCVQVSARHLCTGFRYPRQKSDDLTISSWLIVPCVSPTSVQHPDYERIKSRRHGNNFLLYSRTRFFVSIFVTHILWPHAHTFREMCICYNVSRLSRLYCFFALWQFVSWLMSYLIYFHLNNILEILLR